MIIIVLDAPLGHKFSDDTRYQVYGVGDSRFVFDDDCESCFLNDMDWEEAVLSDEN